MKREGDYKHLESTSPEFIFFRIRLIAIWTVTHPETLKGL
jgi:hypothetical protein